MPLFDITLFVDEKITTTTGRLKNFMLHEPLLLHQCRCKNGSSSSASVPIIISKGPGPDVFGEWWNKGISKSSDL